MKTGKCALCGAEFNIITHHLDKNRKNNIAKNLIRICKPCHYKFHKEDYEEGRILYGRPYDSLDYINKPKLYPAYYRFDFSENYPFRKYRGRRKFYKNCTRKLIIERLNKTINKI